MLHSKIFHYDDPIWDTIYPPNGFNCRCHVRALTNGQAAAKAIIKDTTSETVQQEVGIDKRTGEVLSRPGARVSWHDKKGRRHSFQPDPGWSYNPGKHTLPPADPGNAKAVSGQPTWRDYRRPKSLPQAKTPALLPAQKTTAAARNAVYTALGLTAAVQSLFIDTPVDKVLLDRNKVAHITRKHEHHRERYANRVIPNLQEPNEIWMTYYDNGEFRKHYLKSWDDNKGTLSIITESRDGSLLYNFVPRSHINSRRLGVLLYKQQEKGRGGR